MFTFNLDTDDEIIKLLKRTKVAVELLAVLLRIYEVHGSIPDQESHIREFS